jgi:hypothetical protein
MEKFLEFLLPSKARMGLDFRRAGQLPYIAVTTLILFFVFLAVTGISFSLSGADPFFFCMLTALVLDAAALVCLRRGGFAAATYLTTVSLMGAALSVIFLMSYGGHEVHETYRPMAFSLVMVAVNAIVALNRRQVILFWAAISSGWVIAFFTIFRHYLDASRQEAVSIIAMGVMAFACESAVLFILRSLSDRMIGEAEAQKKAASESLERVSAVVAEARESMGIGDRIVEDCDATVARVSRVSGIQAFLEDESAKLVAETARLRESSEKALEGARRMREGIESQNAAIEQSSSALVEITQNIESATKVASARKAALGQTLENSRRQSELVRELTAAFESVRDSSQEINSFVATVQDVASRTSLLSMNASIEAARAGNSGRGFAVVAQEIRALSGEAQKSADLIKEKIARNEKTVRETGTIVEGFGAYVASSIEELRELLGSIEEILSGISEINLGAGEVMQAVRSLVDETASSNEMVRSVVEGVESQREGFSRIAEFTRDLDDKVLALSVAIAEIGQATGRVAEAGRLNIEQVKKLQGA